MFRQQVVVRPYLGDSAYGPQYGTSYTLKCRIEARQRTVTTRDGEEVVSMARLFCLPGANIPDQSEIVWDGKSYTAVEVTTQPGPAGVGHHMEVTLA